jgi:hypothetical protein
MSLERTRPSLATGELELALDPFCWRRDRRSPLTRLSTRRSGGVGLGLMLLMPGLLGRVVCSLSGSGVWRLARLVFDTDRLAAAAWDRLGVVGCGGWCWCWCWCTLTLLSETLRWLEPAPATAIAPAAAAVAAAVPSAMAAVDAPANPGGGDDGAAAAAASGGRGINAGAGDMTGDALPSIGLP